jgi:hypothetical protein
VKNEVQALLAWISVSEPSRLAPSEGKVRRDALPTFIVIRFGQTKPKLIGELQSQFAGSNLPPSAPPGG